MQAGQIDAILQDQPVNLEHEKADSAYKIVEEYNTDESYGFAFAKGEKTELLKAVNGALTELRDSGDYQKIYDTYFTAN
jgi:polar amino acid transport system substrate-binding protein